VVRLNLFVLAVASLAPLAPFGCPSTDGPVDVVPTERGSLVTTATAVATASVGDTVQLTAAATANADSGTISYAWLQIGGPGVPITQAEQAQASFVAPSLATQQTLVFLVNSYDEAGAVGRAEARVTVAADPDYKPYDYTNVSGGTSAGATGPVADAGDNQTVLPAATVTLNGSASTGKQLTYAWRQVSGATVALSATDVSKPTFTAPAYNADGENALVFELRITDSVSRTVTDRTKVTVRDPNTSDRRVKISTSMGDFTIELNPEKAPISTANFLKYVDEGFYDGTIFHRVIPNFVVQGGGFLPGLTQKETHSAIKNEASNGLKNVRASVAMARTSDVDSATSQWYVNLKDNTGLDYPTNGGYAVFGTVVEGMDVIDRIATVETETRSGFQDVPVTDVILRTARRVTTTP
jgi:cyclophilin family peptidyl-prolyl cis-trans isomerase